MAPAKKSTASKRKPAKKGTRKSASKRKSATKRRSTTTRTGACKTGYERDIFTGRCTRVPCYDTEGKVVPGGRRGADGLCQLKRCGANSILNPLSGKCAKMSSRTGQMLLPYHYDQQLESAQARANYNPIPEGFAGGYAGAYEAASAAKAARDDVREAEKIRMQKLRFDSHKQAHEAAVFRQEQAQARSDMAFTENRTRRLNAAEKQLANIRSETAPKVGGGLIGNLFGGLAGWR